MQPTAFRHQHRGPLVAGVSAVLLHFARPTLARAGLHGTHAVLTLGVVLVAFWGGVLLILNSGRLWQLMRRPRQSRPVA